MKNGINVGFFYLGWFGCILGATWGLWWLGPLIVALIFLTHFLFLARIEDEWLLVVVALIVGGCGDMVMQACAVFEPLRPGPLQQLLPLWYVVLWPLFALTWRHSFAYVMQRMWLAALLGGVGGAMTFIGADALGAVAIAEPVVRNSIYIGAAWALYLALFSLFLRVPFVQRGEVALS